MDPQLPEGTEVDRNFIELSRRAYESFSGSCFPVPKDLIPSFRIWHYPLAGPHVSWIVFQCRLVVPKGLFPMVRRLVWERDADLERLKLGTRRRPNLDPTIVMTETTLDEASMARFVDKATGLTVPLFNVIHPYVSERRPEYGLEGYDVAGRHGRPVMRIEWDRKHHVGLNSVADWAEQVRDWLRAVQL